MATTILIKNQDLVKNTILGGNIDVTRYLPAVKAAQQTLIKPLLGKELYDKISQDFENGTLSGLYLELYEDYVKEMVIHGGSEIYLSTGAYMVSNNGITKTKTDTSETVTKEEIDFLVQSSRKLFNLYEREFIAWIADKDIPEWKSSCTNPSLSRINVGGWSLKRNPINTRKK